MILSGILITKTGGLNLIDVGCGEGYYTWRFIDSAKVSYYIELKETADIFNLLMMTPYSRHVDSNIKEWVQTSRELITEVDINITVYQKE